MDRDRGYRSIAARIIGFETGPASDLLVDVLTLFFLLVFLFIFLML